MIMAQGNLSPLLSCSGSELKAAATNDAILEWMHVQRLQKPQLAAKRRQKG